MWCLLTYSMPKSSPIRHEEDWAPLVAPEAWGGGTLVVTRLVEAFFKEFVGKHA